KLAFGERNIRIGKCAATDAGVNQVRQPVDGRCLVDVATVVFTKQRKSGAFQISANDAAGEEIQVPWDVFDEQVPRSDAFKIGDEKDEQAAGFEDFGGFAKAGHGVMDMFEDGPGSDGVIGGRADGNFLKFLAIDR